MDRRGFLLLAGAAVTDAWVSWSGHDAEGNRVSGRKAVKVKPRAALAPAELADGRDATAGLTAWLMSLPDGAVADLGGLTYRSETYIKLADRRGLTIRNGTLVRTVNSEDPLYYYPKPNPHLWLLRPVDCVVEDVTVQGCHTEQNYDPNGKVKWPGTVTYLNKREFDAAVRVEQFSNVTVQRVIADAIWGDGVQLQVGTGAKVLDSTVSRNGRQGVTVIGRNVLCDNVTVTYSIRSAFDLEPDTSVQGVGDIEIRNCHTRSVGLFLASGGSGPLDNVWIHHNTSSGAAVPVTGTRASNGARRRNWVLEDHVHDGSLGSSVGALKFYNADDITIRRVSLPVAKRFVNGAGTVLYAGLAFELFGCGGNITIEDAAFGQAEFYRNVDPMPGQELVMTGVTPELALTA